MWQRRLRALEAVVDLYSVDDLVGTILEGIFRSYEGSDCEPTTSYRVVAAANRRLCVLRNGDTAYSALDSLDVAPCLERQFLLDVVSSSTGPVLHASALSNGDSAVVLAGVSGSGKTTLTRAGLACELSYVTEECVQINPDGRIVGLPRGIHSDVYQPLPGGSNFDYPWTDTDGHRRVTHLAHPTNIERAPTTVQALFLPRFVPDQPGSARRLSPGTALDALWPCVLNPTPACLDMITKLVARVPVFSLQSSSPEEGLSLVRANWVCP